MTVTIVAAVAENNAIGKDNDLIWSLPDDMEFFKEKTRGKPVIMGRKNYESIPEKYRPLPGRENIIITRKKDFHAPKCKVVHSLEEALEYCKGKEEVCVIGGGEIYKLALEKDAIDVMYITEIHESFDADAFFPEFDKAEWEEEILGYHGIDARHSYPFTFKFYKRRRK